MKKNTKQISVMQVLPHLNSGGLVSGAVEVAKELVNSNFKSLVVSSGGYKENEILRNNSILEKLPVHSKNIFTILNNKKKINITKRVNATFEIREFDETKSLKEIEVTLDN